MSAGSDEFFVRRRLRVSAGSRQFQAPPTTFKFPPTVVNVRRQMQISADDVVRPPEAMNFCPPTTASVCRQPTILDSADNVKCPPAATNFPRRRLQVSAGCVFHRRVFLLPAVCSADCFPPTAASFVGDAAGCFSGGSQSARRTL